MKYKLWLISQLIFFNIAFGQNTQYFNDQESLFREGLELLDKSEYTSARQRFEKYISQSSNDVKKGDAEYYVAFCALGLYHEDGEKRVEDFIANHKEHHKAVTAYFELGNFYFKEKKYKKAAEYYGKVNLALITENQRQETRYKLGYSHFAERNFEDAITYFNVLKRQNGEYMAASNYYAGYIEYELKQYDKAIIDLEKASQNEAYASVAPTLLANLYYKQNRYDDLIGFGTKVINKSEANANHKDLYLLLGDAYLMKNDFTNAAQYYHKYESANSNPANEVRYRIGYTYYKEGDYDEAIDHLKRAATEKDSIGVYASYYLGVMYLKQGNKLYAVTAFDNARNNKINEALRKEGAYQYAKVTYDLGKSEEAVNAFEYYKTQYPKGEHIVEINDLLSEAYFNSNNYDLAINHIEGMGSLTRSQQMVYQKATFYKGSELFNKGDYRQAIDYFKKSLKYPLDLQYSGLANLWSAEAYSVGRRYDEAFPYYRAILGNSQLISTNTGLRARYGIGYAYYNTKEYDKALIHFKEYVNGVEKQSDKMYYDDALLRLADCYYVSKSYDNALSFYAKAIQFNRADNDYALYQTGLINGIEGDVNAAAKAFDGVIAIPRSRYFDDALFQKGQLFLEKGDYEAAIKGFDRLIAQKPNSRLIPYAYSKRASGNYNLQQYEKSIKDYQTILNEYPTHSVAGEVLLPLQEVLNIVGRGGEFDQQLAAYKSANPEKSGLEAVEYESAKNQYFNLNYKRAIERLQAFIKTYPEDPRVMEASYYIAESYYRLRDFEPALEVYNELVTNTSYEQYNRIVGRIAEIEYLSGRYDNAIYFFYQLADISSTKKEQYNAWAGLMESYYLKGTYDSVDRYAEIILEKGNVHISSQNKASLYLGKADFARGNYEQAQDEFLTTLNTARDEYGAEAQYLLGLIYYNTKEYQKSIEALIALNNNFNAYTEWVGKGYMLLAEDYLALGDIFQAKGTLKSIVENFPLEFYKTKAKQKLAEIDKMVSEENSATTNSSDSLTNDN
jgi:tetratricopeptide (TPR) repeat protein